MRNLAPNLLNFCWALGQILIAGIAFYFRDQRSIILLLIGIPLFLLALLYRNMIESPRYLAVKEKFDEAKEAIILMAVVNNREIGSFSF